MAEEIKRGETPAAPPAAKHETASEKRKYTYNGKEIKNPKVFNRYGNLKLRPWAMTDEEIDIVLAKHPALKHLWTLTIK